MKRIEEIRQRIKEKEAEKEGWARDYRTQTARLIGEIYWLYRELEDIQEGTEDNVEIP